MTKISLLILGYPNVFYLSILFLYPGEEELDGSFSSELNESNTSISDAYYDALGTRPPLPDYGYPESYNTVIGIIVMLILTQNP